MTPAPPAPAVTTLAAARCAATGVPPTGLDLGLTSSGLVHDDAVHPKEWPLFPVGLPSMSRYGEVSAAV